MFPTSAEHKILSVRKKPAMGAERSCAVSLRRGAGTQASTVVQAWSSHRCFTGSKSSVCNGTGYTGCSVSFTGVILMFAMGQVIQGVRFPLQEVGLMFTMGQVIQGVRFPL